MTISGGADFTLFEVSFLRYTTVIRIFEYSFIYKVDAAMEEIRNGVREEYVSRSMLYAV